MGTTVVDELDNASLGSIPPSVEDLAIFGTGLNFGREPGGQRTQSVLTTLDLGVIKSIGSIKRLRIALGSFHLPTLTIQNLERAQRLEDLDLDLEAKQVNGLTAVSKLPRLKNLRIVSCSPDSIPPALLESATALAFTNCSYQRQTLSDSALAQLKKNKQLRSLEVLESLDTKVLGKLQDFASLETLLAMRSTTDLDYPVQLPRIRALSLMLDLHRF